MGELAILKLEKAHIARQIMAIHPLAIDTQYVFLVLKNSIEQLKQQAQSMIPGISRNVLLKSEIPLPPISEQRQICQTISLIDSQLQKLS
ncbi:restriction endonuclease subunit S [Ligilactobacillus murinus]|uniref:restriction endonuclease subunit S n=1 Tax=Ligilactobacillus murinus TaxID=1622 RepID=UPI0009DACCE8